MKRRMILRRFRHMCALAALLVCMSARALAYDGAGAWRWMEQFAQALEAGSYTLAVFTRSGMGEAYGVKSATRKISVK